MSLGYARSAQLRGAIEFSSAKAFLASDVVSVTSSLVVDIAMPGMSCPELQQELRRRGYEIPIAFITAQGDESVRQRLLAEGAVECLVKPFLARSPCSTQSTPRCGLGKLERM